MSNLLLRSRGAHVTRPALIVSPFLRPTLLFSRAASVNSAIGKGLRKSKGVGFRGKERDYGADSRTRSDAPSTRLKSGSGRPAGPPLLDSRERQPRREDTDRKGAGARQSHGGYDKPSRALSPRAIRRAAEFGTPWSGKPEATTEWSGKSGRRDAGSGSGDRPPFGGKTAPAYDRTEKPRAKTFGRGIVSSFGDSATSRFSGGYDGSASGSRDSKDGRDRSFRSNKPSQDFGPSSRFVDRSVQSIPQREEGSPRLLSKRVGVSNPSMETQGREEEQYTRRSFNKREAPRGKSWEEAHLYKQKSFGDDDSNRPRSSSASDAEYSRGRNEFQDNYRSKPSGLISESREQARTSKSREDSFESRRSDPPTLKYQDRSQGFKGRASDGDSQGRYDSKYSARDDTLNGGRSSPKQYSQGRNSAYLDSPEIKFLRQSMEDGHRPRPERTDRSGRSERRPERSEKPEQSVRSNPYEGTRPHHDDRFPLSVPYTTTASEFLYGTSVVEAALTSRKIPRRKCYKLYIYAGPNRENVEKDAKIERLARQNEVAVVRVSQDWLPLLDKMSAGRPHNGYVLEASPAPQLPISSLGEVTEKDGQSGINVVLRSQTLEEIEINGTSNFVRTPDIASRKPLVILLDGILDPQNLGGILRTASFLGASAVAVTTQRSASFTPVVMKASAGATENITLFSIQKPTTFITESQAHGWKVYAAVAPGTRGSSGAVREHGMPTPVSLDEIQLQDPLALDPCILMMGSEGEGLHRSLVSKADFGVTVRGARARAALDSLNVNVATGILCNAFMKPSPKAVQDAVRVSRVKAEMAALPADVLF